MNTPGEERLALAQLSTLVRLLESPGARPIRADDTAAAILALEILTEAIRELHGLRVAHWRVGGHGHGHDRDPCTGVPGAASFGRCELVFGHWGKCTHDPEVPK